MSQIKNYYQILKVENSASADEIRSAFRKLALLHHPDKNPGSLEAEFLFRSIHEAYSVLSDAESRSRYDGFLNFSRQPVAPSSSGITSPGENLCSRLNFIFWEMEDMIAPGKKGADLDHGKYGGLTLREWLLKILVFTDRWVLTPTGYGDFFFQARKMEDQESYETLTRGFDPFSHNPYLSFNGYFYKLRVRLGKFINGFRDASLRECIPRSDIRLIDCLYETLNMSYHYMGSIHMILAGKSDTIVPFNHRPGFSDSEVPRLLN